MPSPIEVSPVPSDRVPKASNGAAGNAWGHSRLESQPREKRDGHDETNNVAWRGCGIIAVRAGQPGIGAARNYKSGLVRPVLSER